MRTNAPPRLPVGGSAFTFVARRGRATLPAWVPVALLGLACVGCRPASQLVLVVDTDFDLGREVDALQVVVKSAAGAVVLDEREALAADDAGLRLPGTFGLTPRSDAVTDVVVRVVGWRGTTAVASREVTAGFVAGQTRMLRVVLSACCAGVSCPAGQSCDEGACRPSRLAPEALPAWTGVAPSIARRADGAGGDGALAWRPPRLCGAETRVVTTAAPEAVLDPSRDYRVTLGERVTASGGVRIRGGRNVVVVGGEVDVVPQGAWPVALAARRGLYLEGWTGTMHVEGVWIHGDDLAVGVEVQTRAAGAVLQLENVRVDDAHGRPEERGDYPRTTDLVPAVLVDRGGPAQLRVDRLTGSTDYQAVVLYPFEAGMAIDVADFRRVGLTRVGGSMGCMLATAPSAVRDLRVSDFWVEPNSACVVTGGWQGGEMRGTPRVDFVPVGTAGTSYASPGYQ